MTLYRLDYVNRYTLDDASAPVRDLLGDYLSRSWSKARERAIRESETHPDSAIRVTRISGAGAMRVTALAMDGRVRRV